ncbi:hypothetical protein [Winogradskyella forsetii]|uniref:hypothetical protein n=1 Tax=Winogradskyella forsetii TaxID=2686077 RepID=UPI0015BE13CA|nr:hypothetical protein [Winogradskyella forsetii]
MTLQEILTNIIAWVKTGVPNNVKASNMRSLLTGLAQRIIATELGRLLYFKAIGNSSLDQQIGDIVSGFVEDTFIRDAIYIGGNVSLLSSYFITGSQDGNTISETYDDITSLLAAQGSQQIRGIYLVIDASDDDNVDSGSAVYLYLGNATNDLYDDYLLLSDIAVETIFSSFAFQTKSIKAKAASFPSYGIAEGQIYVTETDDVITSIIYDLSYSAYLAKTTELITANQTLMLNMANTTQNKHIVAEIRTFELVESDTLVRLELIVTGDFAVSTDDMEVNDTIHLGLPYVDSGEGGGSTGLVPQKFTATDAQTVFNVSGSPSDIIAFIGRNLALETTDYTYASGVLTLENGAIESQIITVIPI